VDHGSSGADTSLTSRFAPTYRARAHCQLMTTTIPHVDYLVLGDDPHLEANECTACGARFFDRRNACASCFATEFRSVRIPSEGEVRAFTIVTFAAPGVPVPFVAAVVDCDGTSVRGNLVNVEASPEHVLLGMKVRLALTSLGTDSHGIEAIGYGFEPISPTAPSTTTTTIGAST
jgi:uncharacterized protein